LGYVGRHAYAMKRVDESSTFGLLRVPGLSNLRVSLNGSLVGRTDRSGNLLLRGLQPFRENRISIDTADLPIGVSVRPNPKSVWPAKDTPLSIVLTVVRGGLILHVMDASGKPLAPGGELRSADGRSFPIGYSGRTYLDGLAPGTQLLTSTVGSGSCTLQIQVPSGDAITDIGTQICR